MDRQETEHIIDELEAMKQFSSTDAYAGLQNKIKHKKRQRRKRLQFISIGSAVAAIVLVVIWTQFMTVRVSNPNSMPLSHHLKDGSTVTLNMYSQISYKRTFNHRTIKLKGEAFFEVTPNTQSPFVVKTSNANIKVVGTSFNVLCNEVNNSTEVLVKSGIVELSSNHLQDKTINLEVNDYAIARNKTLDKQQLTDLNYMAWRDHKITFKNQPLSEVVATLNRVYHTDIQLSNKALDTIQLSSTYYQLSCEEVLTSICITLDLQQKQQGNHYILSK